MKIETVLIQKSVHSFHWTKWGGKRPDLIETKKDQNVTSWYCQGCNQEQPIALPPYRIKYNDELGYLSVCPKCFLDQTFLKNIQQLEDVVI